ncbi:MAG: serine hydrolase [Anaerostipes sp.]|nr:serine hydrolase [Anaerostipes sp.]
MKKRIISSFLILIMVCMSGCSNLGSSSSAYENHYEKAGVALKDKTVGTRWKSAGQVAAVIDPSKLDGNLYDDVGEALLINNTKNKVISAQNIFNKAYPASTTKIMTALLTLENCNLNDIVTVEEDVKFKDGAAVSMHLKKGDQISVESLLNGLLLMSANDAAIVLGRHMAGSDKKFAQMMNERAKELGATHTHFVNANGLHEDNHYTTAYDLYLIFRQLIRHNEFSAIAGQANSTVEYKNSKNTPLAYDMSSTNQFLLGEYSLPSNVFMIGGKTGTTTQAGSCLILLTKNKAGDEFISVMLKANNHAVLYQEMHDLLSTEN